LIFHSKSKSLSKSAFHEAHFFDFDPDFDPDFDFDFGPSYGAAEQLHSLKANRRRSNKEFRMSKDFTSAVRYSLSDIRYSLLKGMPWS